MHLRSKLTSDICQKVERLNGKMAQNQLKANSFSFFFLEKALPLKKKKVIKFSVIKIEIPTNLIHLRLKLTSEMYQKVSSLDLRTVLISFIKRWFQMQKPFLSFFLSNGKSKQLIFI